MDTHRPLEIRQLVQQQFEEMSPDRMGIRGEAVLIRGGEYCGHRYQGERVSAVWFREEDQLKFYDGSGSVIRVVRPAELEAARRLPKAA